MAASEEVEQAGSEQYHDNHMTAIYEEGFSFSGYERDLLAMNLGDGQYLDISGVSGLDSISDGRGSVFADFDNDGDLDIFLTAAQHEAHFLFRNNVGSEAGFLRVDLLGTTAGRDAFGAVVRIKTARGVQTKVKAGGSGFLSHNDSRLLFGLGGEPRAEWVEVVWPGGDTQRVEDVAAGSSISLVQGQAGHSVIAENRFRLVDPLDPQEAMLAGLGIEMGEPFPNLTLRSLSGDTIKFQDQQRPGRRRLVNIWATWCVPCAKEMPELQRLYPLLEQAGIDLVGISVDVETLANVPDYVRGRISYPIFTTDESALQTLYPRGQSVVPLTILLDETGRIVEVHSGWSVRSERALLRLTNGVTG